MRTILIGERDTAWSHNTSLTPRDPTKNGQSEPWLYTTVVNTMVGTGARTSYKTTWLYKKYLINSSSIKRTLMFKPLK